MKMIKHDKHTALTPEHPDHNTGLVLLMEALGTTDLDFLNGFLSQIVNVGSSGGDANDEALNFILSIIKGIQPRDQVEAMLAAQMAAVHTATMTFARRLNRVETVQQQDSAEKTFNKLARTFTTQMEALKRYRTGGEQTVTVQHVNVGEGGQAIVGNVTHGRREPMRDNVASPSVLAEARTSPIPIVETQEKIPLPHRKRRENEG